MTHSLKIKATFYYKAKFYRPRSRLSQFCLGRETGDGLYFSRLRLGKFGLGLAEN